MNETEILELITYWQKTAERDYDTMQALFETKRYPESLFFGHIILEKILKALVVKETKKHAPYTHDLERLSEFAKLDLSSDELDLLAEMNEFNIRARYPERKLQLYEMCNQKYTKDIINKINHLYKKLCQAVKLKKS